MDPTNNIFGPEGTRRGDIRAHFDAMNLEILELFLYEKITPGDLAMHVLQVADLSGELTAVSRKINAKREEIHGKLISSGVWDE